MAIVTLAEENKHIVCDKGTTPLQLSQQLEEAGSTVDVVLALGAKHVERNLPALLNIVEGYKASTHLILDAQTGNENDPTSDGLLADAKYEIHQVLRLAADRKLDIDLVLHGDQKGANAQAIRETYEVLAPVYAPKAA